MNMAEKTPKGVHVYVRNMDKLRKLCTGDFEARGSVAVYKGNVTKNRNSIAFFPYVYILY